jgi:hypothetical protein
MKAALVRPPSADLRVQADDGAFELDVVYAEYVRGFDDIPVLSDAVHAPPMPRPPPDFRRGERKDVRKEPRPDSYALREALAAELASRYAEYCGEAPVVPPKRAKPSKRGARNRRKPRAARAGNRGKSARPSP